MTSTTTARRTNPRATKKYKGLIAAELTDAQALKILGREDLIKQEAKPVPAEAKAPKVNKRVADLVASGFTAKQAEKILAEGKGKKKGKKAKTVEPTAKELAEAMVAKQGLAFTRGRTYANPAIIEGQVRVLKTGKPEIIATSGVGRVKAVLITREESGDVAVQNLHKPA